MFFSLSVNSFSPSNAVHKDYTSKLTHTHTLTHSIAVSSTLPLSHCGDDCAASPKRTGDPAFGHFPQANNPLFDRVALALPVQPKCCGSEASGREEKKLLRHLNVAIYTYSD